MAKEAIELLNDLNETSENTAISIRPKNKKLKSEIRQLLGERPELKKRSLNEVAELVLENWVKNPFDLYA